MLTPEVSMLENTKSSDVCHKFEALGLFTFRKIASSTLSGNLPLPKAKPSAFLRAAPGYFRDEVLRMFFHPLSLSLLQSDRLIPVLSKFVSPEMKLSETPFCVQLAATITIQRERSINPRSMNTREEFLDLYSSQPNSLAATYPAVPAPDPPHTPCLLAARWRIHDLYGEDMPQIAADLLEAGNDTPTLRRLAGEMNVKSSSEVEPLIERIFKEFDIRYPLSEMAANLILSRQIAREVIAGIRNPWAAANTLEIAIWGWHPPDRTLGTIFGINAAIDIEPKYRPSLESLKNELLDSFACLGSYSDQKLMEMDHE